MKAMVKNKNKKLESVRELTGDKRGWRCYTDGLYKPWVKDKEYVCIIIKHNILIFKVGILEAGILVKMVPNCFPYHGAETLGRSGCESLSSHALFFFIYHAGRYLLFYAILSPYMF